SVVVQILGLTSSVGRYYSLKEFYEVSRKQPWWGGVALLQNVDALPKMFFSRPDLRGNVKYLTAEERNAVTETATASLTMGADHDPEWYLGRLPNSINMLKPDLWEFKLDALRVPRSVGLTVICILAAVAAFSLHVGVVAART